MGVVTKPLLFGLVSILASCASVRTSIKNQDQDNHESINTLERCIGESLYDFSKRVCNQAGEGHHLIGKSLNLYQVICEEHGGRYIINLGNLQEDGSFTYRPEDGRFDYPEPTRLTPDNFSDYITGKKVMLFGEDHGETEREDAKIFASYIPELRKAGFTYVGLEIDYRYQEDLDKYATNPNEENKTNLLSQLPFYEYTKEDTLLIIDAANKKGMQIICLDNLDPERTIERDEYMKMRIDEVLREGQKIAVFVGGAHVVWSKESTYQYWGDEKLDDLGFINGQKVQGSIVHTINPLGRYLLDSYGKDVIGLVDLTGCYDSYIYACIETEKSEKQGE